MSDESFDGEVPDEIENEDSDLDTVEADTAADTERDIVSAESDNLQEEGSEEHVEESSLDIANVNSETINEDDEGRKDGHTGSRGVKLVKLPLSRIKIIMKTDPTVKLVNQDALISTTKATELFIEYLTSQAFMLTTQSKRKMITLKDVESAITKEERLSFLDGALDY